MKKVVVLGAGYAGLQTVHKLQKKVKGKAEIILVDKDDYHYETTELHEVASGTQPALKITYPIADIIDPAVTKFIQDEVVKLDATKKQVQLKQHGILDYDYCVLALGFVSETFGIKGAKENALEMTNIKQSLAIYDHILASMKKYKETKDKRYLQLVVCGAGFTGIELAGALAEGRPEYAKVAGVAPSEVKITVVEAATRLLPMFSEKLADYGVKLVESLDVELLCGAKISEVAPGKVIYEKDGQTSSLKAETIIWTTGVSGSPVVGESNLQERRGRVVVTDNLTDPNFDDLYILGDVAAVMDKESGRPYPTTAQIATEMAAYAAKDLESQINGNGHLSTPFVYKSKGTVASVGNTHGFGVIGKLEIKGYPASMMKKMIMNKSLFEIGGFKEFIAKGRFDLYH